MIDDTRVTLKLLTSPLTFWTLDEIKNSAHNKVKREDWTDRKREKVGQLCPSTETGAVQGWAMVDSCCQLCSLIKQSMTASSRKPRVLSEEVTEQDHTSSRYPSLNYPRLGIELASILAIITWFWRMCCIGNTGTGRKSLKMSHFNLRLVKAIPDLPARIFLYTLPAFDYFFLLL